MSDTTIYVLRDKDGVEIASLSDSNSTMLPWEVGQWVDDVLDWRGFKPSDLTLEEPTEEYPRGFLAVRETGEFVASLDRRIILNMQPLATHERGAKMLEAA